MSTKEKQATLKAAFVFLVPLENEQPAEAGGRARQARARDRRRVAASTKEKQATLKAAFVFLVPLENEQPAEAGDRARQRGLVIEERARARKQATLKAAFVFLVPLENEQPAKQAVERVSAGS